MITLQTMCSSRGRRVITAASGRKVRDGSLASPPSLSERKKKKKVVYSLSCVCLFPLTVLSAFFWHDEGTNLNKIQLDDELKIQGILPNPDKTGNPTVEPLKCFPPAKSLPRDFALKISCQKNVHEKPSKTNMNMSGATVLKIPEKSGENFEMQENLSPCKGVSF